MSPCAGPAADVRRSINKSGDRLPETSTFELPKLPQLNEDDVKAVRGFLPGKLLGRTAAILSLLLLVLGFSGAVGKGLQYLFNVDLPWWGYAILLALALLAVVAQVLSEWFSERNRQAKQKLAVQTGTQQTGYFRIGPYQDTPLDRERFNRPDRAEEKALDWIRKSSHLPLYFTGDSGSGKSSLLNASLCPSCARKAGLWSRRARGRIRWAQSGKRCKSLPMAAGAKPPKSKRSAR